MSKMLDKVSKLLAQAENAGTPEEGETFMAKAQELATINGVDLAVARLHQAKKERVQEPEERRIQCNPRNRRHNRKHFIELAMAIADVNGVKYLIGGRDTALFAVGFPTDLDVVEALFAHLSVQMAVECDEALKKGAHKEERMVLKTERVEIPDEDRDWGGWNGKDRFYDYEDEEGYSPSTGRYREPYPPPKFKDVPVLDDNGEKIYELKTVSRVDGRVFRGDFYEAFIMRMRGRLWEIRKSVERERGADDATSETALALRDKKQEIKAKHEEQRAAVRYLGTYKSTDETDRKRDFSGTARQAGTASAERVPIETGREVKSS